MLLQHVTIHNHGSFATTMSFNANDLRRNGSQKSCFPLTYSATSSSSSSSFRSLVRLSLLLLWCVLKCAVSTQKRAKLERKQQKSLSRIAFSNWMKAWRSGVSRSPICEYVFNSFIILFWGFC